MKLSASGGNAEGGGSAAKAWGKVAGVEEKFKSRGRVWSSP